MSTNMFNLSSKFQGLKIERKAQICELFRSMDFESLMYPCFIFCRILGILPYKINGSTIKICKQYFVLSTIIFTIFCIGDVIIIYNVYISKNIIRQFKKDAARTLITARFYIFHNFITIATFILIGPRMRLLQTILELSLGLPQKAYQNLSRQIHTMNIFGFFYIIMQLWLYYIWSQADVMRKIFHIYVMLLDLQINMLYVNCVCVLKACFKQINDSLVNLREFMANDELYLLRGPYHELKNPFILMELKTLKKQHLALSDTVQMMKTTFSLQLISTITGTFIAITLNLYSYVMQVVQEAVNMSNKEKQLYSVSRITAVIYEIIKLLLIVWACQTAKNQAMEVNTTVLDVSNSISDEEIKYESQLFSLQLMHRKIIFSATVFNLDATLVVTMIGFIVTYLLILIQFMSASCYGKA